MVNGKRLCCSATYDKEIRFKKRANARTTSNGGQEEYPITNKEYPISKEGQEEREKGEGKNFKN